MASRVRLDKLLVDTGLVESREKAARLILAGEVLIDGQRVDKAGSLIPTDADIELKGRSPYVSRGGEKLVHALDPRVFDDQPSLAVVDVAFISLEKVLPAVFGVLAPRSEIVALVKPQFEVGREHVGKGGVVRDPALHRAAVRRLARYAVLRGWHVLGVTASPLRGPKGNREFFLHFSAQGKTAANLESLIERSVVEAVG